jgi:phage terminase large subunit-like protein
MTDGLDILDILDESIDHGAASPLDHVRLTQPQTAWLNVDAPVALWRAGNQLGKSWAQAVDIVAFCRGTHPQQTHRPPVRIVVASESWAQMVPLATKLWELLPKDEIDPKLYYAPGQGIKGYKEPVVPFVAGPGAGSEIILCTYSQGAVRLAGGTFHRGYCDEPPPEHFFGELRPRLNVLNGHLRMTFTPTPESPPLDYLREKVEKWRKGEPGGIYEHHTVLEPEACHPVGALIPFMTEAKIGRFAADCLPAERAMRMEGAWEPLTTERWLTSYTDEMCARSFTVGQRYGIGPKKGAKLAIGIDHGAAAGKQAACLIAVDQGAGLAPKVWVIDELLAEATTTPERDARQILDMLERHGLTYDDIDEWVGDRPLGSHRSAVQKGNADLKRYLAAALNRPPMTLKWIHIPKKFSGSVWYGARIMNAAMGRTVTDDDGERSHFLVHPRCAKIRDSFKAFRGDKRDPHKDIFDACRYAVERLVSADGWMQFTALYG